MSAEHEIAAPALSARREALSPWRAAAPASAVRRWMALLADAWREGMALYVRASLHRGGHWGGF